MSFEVFAADQNRKSNIIMMGLGAFLALSYAPIDLFVFETPFAYFVIGIRLVIVCPLLVFALYAFNRASYRLAEESVCIAIITLLGIYHLGFLFNQFANPSLSTVFAITAQTLCFVTLTIYLRLRAYLWIAASFGLCCLIAIVSTNINIKSHVTYLSGMVGLSLFLGIWLLIRHQLLQAEYKIEKDLSFQLAHRASWNNLLRETVKNKANLQLRGISEQLKQIHNTGSQARFLQRAIDSTREIECLANRIASSTQWEMFDSDSTKLPYSVTNHLGGLVDEYRHRYADSTILFSTNSDFDAQIEKELLTRLVTNVVDNAVRHSAKQKPVEISIESNRTIRIYNEGEKLPSDFGELTEAGKQGKVPGRFGLGLFVCKRICSGHGIDWSIRNKHKGVEVLFRFPACTRLPTLDIGKDIKPLEDLSNKERTL